MNTKYKVLLTGASGTIGYEILKMLATNTDVDLYVFDIESRRARKFFASFKNRAEIIWGNLASANDMTKIPPNMDIVIHLAAIIPPLADKNPNLTYKVNVLGTKALINQLEKTSANAFILYSSSIAVYGDRLKNPYINVGDSLLDGDNDVYAKSKIEAEELFRSSKLNWSIFRLAAIMKNHKMSGLMFHMPLETKLEICTATDTARAFVNAVYVDKKRIQKQIFNLGGGETCRTTYKEFLEKSFQLVGLGALDFPENAFARKNFHCGYYQDGQLLEDILHFRHDSLGTYFINTKNSIPGWKIYFAPLFRKLIKNKLLSKSEPYNAIKQNNSNLIKNYF